MKASLSPEERNREYPLIPEAEIEAALASSALPKFYRNPTRDTVVIHEIVTVIKAARELGKPFSQEWDVLRQTLDNAAVAGQFEAFDDFSKAWKEALPDIHYLMLNGKNIAPALGGNYQAVDAFPEDQFEQMIRDGVVYEIACNTGKGVFLDRATNKRMKRQPKTWLVVDCIKHLQWHLGRVPTRKEILENFSINSSEDEGITEADLSRQLTRLGWNDRIPPESWRKSLGE
ncbi:MAG: hypothetical protein KF712_04110 [Akkermansiaceae bacterium]|nr:hypothetical protein [Akkermansiaceae bacterium]